MDIAGVKDKLIRDIELLRAPEGYVRAGYPRFFKLFGRDSLIVAWQLLDYDPSIARNTLKVLADIQGRSVDAEREEEPGKILHEWWGDMTAKTSDGNGVAPRPFPYYGSIDSTFLYLILASLYFKKTDDADFFDTLRGAILSAVEWAVTYADTDNDLFIDFQRKNPRGLYSHGWRDSSSRQDESIEAPIELVEVQGYAYAAYIQIQDLLRAYGEDALAARLRERAELLKEKFLKDFWWEEEKYYYFLLDKHHVPARIVASNPGHLLFTGILSREGVRAVCERLFRKDMWTPYGIRTQSVLSEGFDASAYQKGSVWPHDNWIIAYGLKANGYDDSYYRIKEALLRAFTDAGGASELYAVDMENRMISSRQSNTVQAWSAGALLHMLLHE